MGAENQESGRIMEGRIIERFGPLFVVVEEYSASSVWIK